MATVLPSPLPSPPPLKPEVTLVRLLIVTNVAAPYRLPVWNALSEMDVDLTVALLEDRISTGLGMPVERARDWQAAAAEGGATRLVGVDTIRLVRGEDHYYIAKEKVFGLLRQVDAVILCGWESPAFWQFLVASKLTRTPVLGFYESTLETSSFSGGPIGAARRFFMQALDAVIVPGASAELSVLDKGVAPDRVWRGFNAVDMTGFAAVNAPGDVGSRQFLFVGKLVERKNVDTILDAFARQPTDCRLSIAGSGVEEERLRDRAEQLGIAERIDWLGYVPYADLPRVMAQHGHLLMVSHVEVWGLTVNEALAAGMHAIVGRRCGVAASVADMPGVLLCGTSVDSVAQAMTDSLKAWSGRIQNPPILDHDPRALAATYLEAVRSVVPAGPGITTAGSTR